MKKTTTLGFALTKSFYTMEELMEAWAQICERGSEENFETTVTMSDWYGDPYRRDIRMSMTFVGCAVLMEEKDGWTACEPLGVNSVVGTQLPDPPTEIWVDPLDCGQPC